jgi:hypothetical protein
MARAKNPSKVRVETMTPVKQRGPSNMEMVLAQRDKLYKDNVRHRAECDVLSKTAAEHLNEKHELMLENNMMREYVNLQTMMMRSEQHEVDNERMRLSQERTALHAQMVSLDVKRKLRGVW